MKNNEIPLLPGQTYHIYNHANGKENLFVSRENFLFFLKRYSQFIYPVAETFAYCLMPNHLHFAVRIRSEDELQQGYNMVLTAKAKPIQTLSEKELAGIVGKSFGNLFSSYAQAFNKQQNRMGSLFIPNFKRQQVDNQAYLNNLIRYIHSNPVHHGFTKTMLDWEFSSIHGYWLDKQTRIAKGEILESFGGKEGFIARHQTPMEIRMDMEF